MSKGTAITKLHRALFRLHRWLPYRLSASGYAFPPLHYYLELTRRCNLRCVMCQYIEWLKKTPADAQREGELSTDEWRRVIDQISPFTLITFTGGEPLLRKDFLDLLAHAGARHRTHFISNATLLDDDRADRVARSGAARFGRRGLNFIGVSLDGPEPVHDEIRSMAGAFAKSTNGIRRVIERRRELNRGCPLIHVTTVIQKANLDHLAEMPRVVKELGADVINFTLEVRTHELEGFGQTDPAKYRPEDLHTPRLEPDRLRVALRDTHAAAEKLGVDLRMPDMPDEEIVRYYAGTGDLRGFRCGFIWSGAIVGYQGTVYPCWLQPAGNVRDTPLRAIWNGPRFREFRRRVRQGLPAPCAGCCFLTHTGG